ncbi:MAG TPA: AAA domain-containing protein, partial [Micromonosporaceae bacterium]|nr:AAA domain-containing protein [Micromonosporaceae bacterium]
MTPSITTILRALADLAPAGSDRLLDVTRGGQPLVWLRDPERGGREADLVRLAAVDLLHSDARILRRAWGMVAGAVEVDGVLRKVRLPLLSEPVRLERVVRGYRVVPAGDLELTPLVEDRELAARLESAPGLGSSSWLSGIGTAAWLRTVAEAAGLAVAEVVRPGDGRWPPRPPAQGLCLYASAALYTVRDVFGVALADGLRAWAGRPDVASTALAAVYGVGGPPVDQAPAADAVQVLSPLPLTATQAEVVRRARTEMVSVVSGPPGNGKSHAVVAAAVEVIDRGGSVLVATQSAHAAEVLGALLSRYPGPTPVLFGDAERRTVIAMSLAQGSLADRDDEQLGAAEAAVMAAADQVRRLSQEVSARLELELRAGSLPRWEPFLGGLLLDVPRAFQPEAELGSAARLLGRVEHLGAGGWRRALVLRRLRRRLGAKPGVPLDRLRDALEAAAAQQAAARLAATGGTDLQSVWSALFDAEAALAAAVGTAMYHRARSSRRWDDAARRSAAALATALRAGRNRRRELLAALDGRAVVRALPLWVGTVADVEDLLPPVPGLFDLVIIDEASHTDQIRAAPVLARARRALIVGDPRQLRFVSFVADVDVTATLARHGLDDRLDVRRVSTFDLAAGAAPVVWLEEHFRSVPQLIGFSARRFYADRIAMATRHPRTDGTAAIEVRRVPAGI